MLSAPRSIVERFSALSDLWVREGLTATQSPSQVRITTGSYAVRGTELLYLEIIDRLSARGVQGVILGCTEIFLLVSQADRPALPMFDTTTLHAEAAVAMAFGE